ncbi:MAG: class I SAM-dependent methyltransferase [Desulfobacterales bacterium]|nr:class I SAM-dependent methyltransferase [Desulfobacterales bacterium]
MTVDKFSSSPTHPAVAGPTQSAFCPRYLAAKKAIDDRALNHHVWETLRQALARTPGPEPLKILEIGAGTGAMLERIVERGLLPGPAVYVASDSDPGQLEAARNELSQWAQKRGEALSWSGRHRCRLLTADIDLSLVLETARAEALADRSDSFGAFDLLIAHAVLDLVDFPALLPRLLPRLKANGLAYLTCNFDGDTLFLPEWDGEQEILRQYHASMDARIAGASHTGRRLLTFLQRPGLELLAAGSSDWVIHPRNAGYTMEETFFLHALIETIERELAKKSSPPSNLATWARFRREQVAAGELSLLARHLDFLARRQGPLP